MNRIIVMLVISGLMLVPSAGLAQSVTAQEDITGDLLGPIDPTGGVDCQGNIFGPGTQGPHGTVIVHTSYGPHYFPVNVVLEGGDPNTTYSVELFEATADCGDSNNAANTGFTVTTDDNGYTNLVFPILLPYFTLGGESIGDGAGSEQMVAILDRSLSLGGGGDRFVAKVSLQPDSPPSDTTKPTITLNSPTDGATYTLGQSVNADYSCSDDTSSGSDLSCEGSVGSGSPVDTGSVGTTTFTVSATDKAGNTEVKTTSYTVVSPCTIGDIEPPVNDVSGVGDPGMSAYKYGSRGVIPAKFKVACDNDPIDTQTEADAHPMKLTLSKLGSTPDQDAVVENTMVGSANTGDLFRFDDAADDYIYNVGLKNLTRGTYRMTISEANDGASQDEWFSIK